MNVIVNSNVREGGCCQYHQSFIFLPNYGWRPDRNPMKNIWSKTFLEESAFGDALRSYRKLCVLWNLLRKIKLLLSAVRV